MNHTKGKWEVLEYGADYIIALCLSKTSHTEIASLCDYGDGSDASIPVEANAHRICHCVNNFDAVVEALEKALKGYENICDICESTHKRPCKCKWEPMQKEIKQALALAREEGV